MSADSRGSPMAGHSRTSLSSSAPSADVRTDRVAPQYEKTGRSLAPFLHASDRTRSPSTTTRCGKRTGVRERSADIGHRLRPASSHIPSDHRDGTKSNPPQCPGREGLRSVAQGENKKLDWAGRNRSLPPHCGRTGTEQAHCGCTHSSWERRTSVSC